MTQELTENQTNRTEVDRLDTEVAELRERLTEVKGQLEESSKDTGRERAKNVSLSKHVEVSQNSHVVVTDIIYFKLKIKFVKSNFFTDY